MNTGFESLFNVEGKCIVITGGAGVLCSEMAEGLARHGAKICVIDCDAARGNETVEKIKAESGSAIFVEADVLNKKEIQKSFDCAVKGLGRIDVLINGAGGNRKEATCGSEMSFFDLPADALRWVLELNCLGTMLCSQVFGRHMAERGEGVIINISSMNAFRPLTNIATYSAAKAAVSNFTQWLAVYMAQQHSPNIRINAVAPGFFLTEQNRFLLTEETGELTPRGKQIISHTPMNRFGEPTDLLGALIWLISDASKFVTGIIVPVDGGFNAYGGV